MKAKKVTFADIAAYTGFSKTTISRYFNNPDSLTLENQQKIADALVELDYKENKVGRILASGQDGVCGHHHPQPVHALLLGDAEPDPGHLRDIRLQVSRLLGKRQG